MWKKTHEAEPLETELCDSQVLCVGYKVSIVTGRDVLLVSSMAIALNSLEKTHNLSGETG